MGEHAVRQREDLRLGEASKRRNAFADHPLADHHVANQSTLFAEGDLGAKLELADLADVVQQRSSKQQIRVEPGMYKAQLVRQRGHTDCVLEQAAEIGVMPIA